MRVVSLLPAATEWLMLLGLCPAGRSHACDFPPEVRQIPVLTRSVVSDEEGDSRAIHRQVAEHLRQGLPLFTVDMEALRACRPDLVITQDGCAVCAVPEQMLEERLEALGIPRMSFAPVTFKGVLDGVLHLARRVGRLEVAMSWLAEAEARVVHLQQQLGLTRRGPRPVRVVVLEWLEPLMVAGNWVPDVVDLAGGEALLAERGKPSRWITPEALLAADPDVLVMAPCGFSLEAARRDTARYPAATPWWSELRAVREGRVFLLDGRAYLNRPGPRLYRAVELLAAGFFPSYTPPSGAIEPWEMFRWPPPGPKST